VTNRRCRHSQVWNAGCQVAGVVFKRAVNALTASRTQLIPRVPNPYMCDSGDITLSF
jgi:hypothetical protein